MLCSLPDIRISDFTSHWVQSSHSSYALRAPLRIGSWCVLPRWKATQASLDINTTRNINGKAGIEAYQEEKHTLIWEQLQTFPTQELIGKVVLVRCDLAVSFEGGRILDEETIVAATPTIMYLQNVGARVVLASSWHPINSSAKNLDTRLIADCITKHTNQEVQVAGGVAGDAVRTQIETLGNGGILLLGNLQLHKEEAANNKEFARKLTEKVDVFVNDAFPIAHRVLASTVASARFTSARLAGFQLGKELFFLTMAMEKPKHPFIAVVGGGKVSKVIGVLHSLVNKCDTIVITGSMVYTFLFALDCQRLSDCIEEAMVPEILELMKVAHEKDVDIFLPSDFVCVKGQHIQVFKVGTVHVGWKPVFWGPQSLEDINTALQVCKMALWIGPVSMGGSIVVPELHTLFAKIFGRVSQRGCITIVGGKEACGAIKKAGVHGSISHMSRAGSAFHNVLKGATLPGVATLDIACPPLPNWQKAYRNPYLPLFIDIGSGNGLFCLEMAKKYEEASNFLGLEINKKLVDHCLTCTAKLQLSNAHFIAADATSVLRRALSNYPGQVAVVAIQCPDPNFADPDSRWRMVQRPLVNAIVELLCKDGKVFLQSDVKAVALQLKSEFLQYGRERLVLSIEHQDPKKCDAEGWLKDNPFGILTDWESHVLERGDQMYRVLLSEHAA